MAILAGKSLHSPLQTVGLADGSVTFAKMQDIATDRLIGRDTVGTGDPEEVTLSQALDFVGSVAHGDILYRGAATWTRLAAGTSGYFLRTQGSGQNPVWADPIVVDARLYGVLFDGNSANAAANLTAWNLIVAAINAGTVQHVQCPPGTAYLSGDPNEITASDWVIAGSPFGTKLIMASTAGTASRFFKLGNASTAVQRAAIIGFTLACENDASLTGGVDENCFVCTRATDVTIRDIQFSSSDTVNGLCTLGSTSDAVTCNRVYFENIRGGVIGAANSKCIDIQYSSGHTFAHISLFSSAIVETSHIGLHIHPENGDVIDGGTFLDVDFNYVTTNKPDKAIVIDATEGIITNQVFTDIVADHVNVAGVTLTIGSGPHASARMNNVRFTNCRTTGDGTEGLTSAAVTVNTGTDVFTSAGHGLSAGNPVVFSTTGSFTGITVGTTYYVIASGLTTDDFKVSATPGGSSVDVTAESGSHTVLMRAGKGLVIDNTGNAPMRNLQWIGGLIQSYESNAVDFQSNNEIGMLIEGAGLTDTGDTTARPAVAIAGGEGLRINNCYTQAVSASDTCAWTYGVSFSGNSTFSEITGNDFRACTIADVNTESIGSANLAGHNIRGNKAPDQNALGRTTTTDATVTTIASIPLTDARVYHIRVIVWGVQDGGSNRATYELRGTFYRTGGGGATLVGSVTTDHSAESDATWAATMDASGNNARVRVTGVAATTIDWGVDILEVKSFAE